MYKTGHSLIKAKMKQEHAELAGEMSGHMFFADRYYGYDDAIYAACRLLEIVSKSGKPLSHQLEGIPKLVSTPELRIDCPDDVKFKVVAKVAELVKRRHEIVDVDGVRVPFEQGWGLVRASNTQPVLVMRFEATSKELLEKYQHEIEESSRAGEERSRSLVLRADVFGAAGQRLHGRAAANADSGIQQRIQQIEKNRVNDLFAHGLGGPACETCPGSSFAICSRTACGRVRPVRSR